MITAHYQAPYQLPAGILTLAVHLAFLALLYFGFTWRTQPPATISVDLWRSIPTVSVPLPPRPKVEQAILPPIQAEPAAPPVTVKPEIVLPDKPKPKIKPIEKSPVETKPVKRVVKILDEVEPDKPQPLPVKPPEVKPVEQKVIEPKPVDPAPAEKQPDNSAADQQAAREQAEKSATKQSLINEYIARISAKIKQNIVPPPDVADDALAEFNVTLLPGGAVLPPVLSKSSGNPAYDNAVERAILKSQPLPLPPDSTLSERFRKLKLQFRPTEKRNN